MNKRLSITSLISATHSPPAALTTKNAYIDAGAAIIFDPTEP
jgi:hypothetical protein